MPKLSSELLRRSVLSCAALLPLLGASPAFADTNTAAEFTLATCLGAIDDLSKVDEIARAKNWTASPDVAAAPQFNGFKLKSAWMVKEGDENMIVMTGSHQMGGPVGSGNACFIVFPGASAKREAFFDTISKSLMLKSAANMTFPAGRMDMYEVEGDRPNKLIFQIVSMSDDDVKMASFLTMNVPPASPEAAHF
jgi:hypothetical protein